MIIDLNSLRNAKKTNTQNVVDLFDSEEYSTKVLYKKEQIDGKTYIRGVFSSCKKGDSKDNIDSLENNQFYYSHNQSDPSVLETNKSTVNHGNTISISIIIITILLTIELIKYLLHTLSHNDIEMNKCKEVNIH
jgi:hypothetical protein